MYDAFGNLIQKSGTTANAYLYCGEQYDADLGMYDLRARYMEPGRGRFWNMDTYEGDGEDPASLHKYLYCCADPINRADPSGHFDGIAGLSFTSIAIGTVAAIAVVSVYQFTQAIQTGGEGLENPIGLALAGLSTGAATTLIASNYESVRDQIKRAAISLAIAITWEINSPKIVPVSRSITPTIAANVEARQEGHPQELHRVGIIQRNINRARALSGKGPAGPGLSWDEYPFASTSEGGQGASVVRVPQMENWKQGGIVGGSYLIEGINVGDEFWAVVVP